MVAAAAASVFFAFDALPFMDLPAHAGIFALRGRFAVSAFEQRFYVLAPHLGGYSLFRFLGDALTSAFGPVAAVRTLGAVSVVALALAVVDARRRLYGRASAGFGFLGLALGLGLMTIFGFASFLLGIALLLACTSAWLGLLASIEAGDRGRRGEITLGALACVLVLTHGFAFALFLAIAATAAVARGGSRARFVRARALGPSVALAVWAAWVARPSVVPPGSAPVVWPRSGALFQPLLDKLSLLLTPTLMTRTGVDVAACAIVWAVVVGGVVATVAWLRRGPRADAFPQVLEAAAHARALLACALLLALVFIALPHEFKWFGFIDGRLVPVILLLAALAVPDEATGRRLSLALERVVPLVAVVQVALALWASRAFQREAAGYREVFAHVPAQTRVLNLPLDPDSDVFSGHPFVHYDKLILVERALLVSDLWFHQGSAIFPREGNPALRLPPDYRSSDVRVVDWSRFVLGDWDLVLVRTRPGASPPLVPATLLTVAHSGGWWLYSTSPGATLTR